jgi:RNA polymerase sporulation-specific sigma factor
MNKYNDNELLYLLYEGEEVARQLLFKKYKFLIYKRLRAFRIKDKNFDDFFQEGLMALNDAINHFNPYYHKSFNKYFDLILQRRIISILRRESDYFYNVMLVEDIWGYIAEEPVMYDQPILTNNLNDFETDVFNLRFKQNYKAKEISELLHCDIKKVYNTIYAVKQKITMENGI